MDGEENCLFSAPTQFLYNISLWDGDKSRCKAKIHCLVVSLAIRGMGSLVPRPCFIKVTGGEKQFFLFPVFHPRNLNKPGDEARAWAA